MIPFKNYGPLDRTEWKALAAAGLCCFVFIVFLSVVYSSASKRRKVVVTRVFTPQPPRPPSTLPTPEPPPPPSVDLNAQYQIVPENFRHIDFGNLSYGPYTSPHAKAISLKLKDGELQLPDASSWFEVQDVHYKDLTGDRKPEAIVRLSHVQCGGSCDGGSTLFYVYTRRKGKLQQLWKYETGSYAYGCGLRSFTASGRQLVLELFGRCPKEGMEDPGTGKFLAKNLTYVLFEFHGGRFKQKKIEFFDSPTFDVKNHNALMYFY